MAKPILVMDDWYVGMSGDPEKGFQTLYGWDLHAQPGLLIPQYEFLADSDAIINTNDDLILWFTTYDEDGLTPKLYAYDDRGVLYVRESGVWTELRDTWQSQGHGLLAFGDSLYYVRRAYLGKLTGDDTVGGNYNDTFKSLAENLSSGQYSQMAIFAGSLYVPNGRYISKLDSDGTTWTAQALTLAIGYRIRAMTVWNDYLVASTDSTTAVDGEQIIFWDGTSTAPSIIIDVPKPGASALINWDNLLLAFISNKIFKWTGSEFEIMTQFPKTSQHAQEMTRKIDIAPGAVLLHSDRVLIGARQGIVGGDTQFLSGVWSLGRHDENKPIALAFEYPISTGETDNIQLGGLASFSSSNDEPFLYLGYDDNSTTGIDKLNVGKQFEAPYIVSPTFTLPSDFGKLIQGVRIRFHGDMIDNDNANKVTVYYRTDNDIDYFNDTTDWTELGVIDNDEDGGDNQNDILYGIYERPERIQFKFDFSGNNGLTFNNITPTKIEIF